MRPRKVLLLVFAVISFSSFADHFAGGTITTRCLGNNFHEVTLQLFRNCSGSSLQPQVLDFSNDCGVIFQQTGLLPDTVVEVSPLCEADLPNSTCNGGSLMGFDLTTYRTTVYLSPCSRWVISWNTCCRNSSLNLVGSPGLYVEATLNNLGGACNIAPEFTNNLIPLVCLDQPVSYDASAMEPDGNELSYALVDARFGSPTPVAVLYAPGYDGSAPFTGMVIDENTGTISFLPTLAGVIIVAVEVTETNSQGAVIGTVMRDFLFVVSACANTVPSVESGTFTSVTGPATIIGERDLSICGSDAFCATLAITDANIDQVLTLETDVEAVMPGAILTLTGNNPVEAELCWAGAIPGLYTFSITATDNACPVVGSQIYDYTVVVNVAPDAGISSSISVCENEQPFNMTAMLEGTPSMDGTWSDPEGDTVGAQFDPGTSGGGTYTYTVGTTSCAASSTLAIVVRPATDPECLTAGLANLPVDQIRLIPDAFSVHSFWLTAPAVEGTLHLFASDGRLILEDRFVSTGSTPIRIDVPADHHGLVLLHLTDIRTARRFVLRTSVP